MYTYICVYTHTHTHTRTRTRTRTHTHTHIQSYTYTVYIYNHTQTYTYIHIYIYILYAIVYAIFDMHDKFVLYNMHHIIYTHIYSWKGAWWPQFSHRCPALRSFVGAAQLMHLGALSVPLLDLGDSGWAAILFFLASPFSSTTIYYPSCSDKFRLEKAKIEKLQTKTTNKRNDKKGSNLEQILIHKNE